MLTPREIVLRLNGGGDGTPLGGVDVPPVVVVPVPCRPGGRAGGRRAARRRLPARRSSRSRSPTGSGRSLRPVPVDLEDLDVDRRSRRAACRSAAMILSMICTTDAVRAHGDRVGRLVGDDRRLHRDAGQPNERAQHLRQLGRIGVRDVERADDLLVVLRVLRRRVREDEDRSLVHDLVRQLVHRHDLIERLLERDAVELNGDRPVLHVAVVRDVDAGRRRR